MDKRLESATEKSFTLNSEAPETLVIYCADPRFRSAFEEFVKSELGVGHHALFSLAGGVGPFVQFDPKWDQLAPLRDQLLLFLDNNDIKELIVLNHADCKWYAKQMPDQHSKSIAAKQIADLQAFARMVRSDIADVPVRTYLAVLTNENIRFVIVPNC
jgi:carbonic anhydrase